MLTLYLSSTPTDLSEGLWNGKLYYTPSHISYHMHPIMINPDDNTWYSGYFYTDPGTLVKDSWADGSIDVHTGYMSFTDGNGHTEIRCSASRISSNGDVQETTDWSNILLVTASLTVHPPITIPSYTWDYANIQDSDRLRLNWQVRNTSAIDEIKAFIEYRGVADRASIVTPFNMNHKLNHFQDPTTDLIVGTGSPTLLITEPVDRISIEQINAEGTVVTKGDFTENTFKGYFRYAKGTLINTPTPVDIYDYSYVPIRDYPPEWGTFGRAIVKRVRISSDLRGLIYDVTDTNSSLHLKDKTSTVLTIYPGEILTVGIDWGQTGGAMSATILWGNSFPYLPNPEYTTCHPNHAGLKNIDSAGLHYFDPWTVPDTMRGPNLMAFSSGGTAILSQRWMLSAYTADRSYIKIPKGEWYKETPPSLTVEDQFSDSFNVDTNEHYSIVPVVDIYTGLTYLHTYREIDPLFTYIEEFININTTIKDTQNTVLGSTNLLDYFTENDWAKGVFQKTTATQGKLTIEEE